MRCVRSDRNLSSENTHPRSAVAGRSTSSAPTASRSRLVPSKKQAVSAGRVNEVAPAQGPGARGTPGGRAVMGAKPPRARRRRVSEQVQGSVPPSPPVAGAGPRARGGRHDFAARPCSSSSVTADVPVPPLLLDRGHLAAAARVHHTTRSRCLLALALRAADYCHGRAHACACPIAHDAPSRVPFASLVALGRAGTAKPLKRDGDECLIRSF